MQEDRELITSVTVIYDEMTEKEARDCVAVFQFNIHHTILKLHENLQQSQAPSPTIIVRTNVRSWDAPLVSEKHNTEDGQLNFLLHLKEESIMECYQEANLIKLQYSPKTAKSIVSLDVLGNYAVDSEERSATGCFIGDLLHEIGHFFGASHAKEGIMSGKCNVFSDCASEEVELDGSTFMQYDALSLCTIQDNMLNWTEPREELSWFRVSMPVKNQIVIHSQLPIKRALLLNDGSYTGNMRVSVDGRKEMKIFVSSPFDSISIHFIAHVPIFVTKNQILAGEAMRRPQSREAIENFELEAHSFVDPPTDMIQ